MDSEGRADLLVEIFVPLSTSTTAKRFQPPHRPALLVALTEYSLFPDFIAHNVLFGGPLARVVVRAVTDTRVERCGKGVPGIRPAFGLKPPAPVGMRGLSGLFQATCGAESTLFSE